MADAEKAVEKTAKQIQKAVDASEEKGYLGVKDETIPNEAWSLETGPDSPGHLEVQKAVLDAHVKDLEAHE